jgi:hypothetical protein
MKRGHSGQGGKAAASRNPESSRYRYVTESAGGSLPRLLLPAEDSGFRLSLRSAGMTAEDDARPE